MEAIATSVEITPQTLLSTACGGTGNTPSIAVATPLEANVLGFRDNQQTLIVVSVDWFFASPSLRSRILRRCAGFLDDAGLFIVASHTHASPNPDATKIGFSKVDFEYVAWAEDIIANCVEKALCFGEWRCVQLRYSATPCDCAIHRRRQIWSRAGFGFRRLVSLFPNPDGPRDRELRLLRVDDQEGGVLAIIWGVSCHPTEWPQSRELSSDYPGGVRQALRARIGAAIPIIFLQGFCGDLRPPSIGRWPKQGTWHRNLLKFASSLLNGPIFVGFTQLEYQLWMNNIAACALKAFGDAADEPRLHTKLLVQRNSIDLSSLGLSGEISRLTLHSFEFDEKLRIVGISAEVCWEYAKLIRRALPGKTIWPVGYIDTVFGYLPTDAMLPESGYEVDGFKKAFGITGKFVPNLEEIITKALP